MTIGVIPDDRIITHKWTRTNTLNIKAGAFFGTETDYTY